MRSLPEQEFILLEERVRVLQKTIRPGVKRHNWNSLAIADYINRCEEALSNFESFVTQVCHNYIYSFIRVNSFDTSSHPGDEELGGDRNAVAHHFRGELIHDRTTPDRWQPARRQVLLRPPREPPLRGDELPGPQVPRHWPNPHQDGGNCLPYQLR